MSPVNVGLMIAAIVIAALVIAASLLASVIYLASMRSHPIPEPSPMASVSAEGLPTAEYDAVTQDQRQPFEGGQLIIKNESEQDWKSLNIKVNRHYILFDSASLPSGSSKRYELVKFCNRTGARFSLRHIQLESVLVDAKATNGDRVTFRREFGPQ